MTSLDLSAAVRAALIAETGPELLAELAVRPTFGRLLDAVLADPGRLRTVAARSYRHVLGFDKVILASVQPYGQLRLHVWWPDSQRHREHVHDHRFPFSSVVLAGRLRTSLYVEDPAGEPVTRYRETSDAVDRRWRFEEVGPAALRTVLVADQPAGTAYTLSAEVLHRIEASPVLSATLFLETRQQRPSSSVYVGPVDGPPTPAPQTAFAPTELAARLTRLREAADGILP
jgi:hypothetical protein